MADILYSFRRCPYAMRARMALAAAQIDCEHREIILRDKPASMLEFSPKGTVPVFVMADGTVIDESLELMQWALEHSDPENWLNTDKTETLYLISINDGDFKHHLDRYKYPSRYGKGDRGTVDIEHRDAACEIIDGYETRLNRSKHLMGNTATLADIAIFPFLRQFANTDRSWWDSKPFEKTHAWLEGHLASDLFAQIMKKYPLWDD